MLIPNPFPHQDSNLGKLAVFKSFSLQFPCSQLYILPIWYNFDTFAPLFIITNPSPMDFKTYLKYSYLAEYVKKILPDFSLGLLLFSSRRTPKNSCYFKNLPRDTSINITVSGLKRGFRPPLGIMRKLVDRKSVV